MSFERYKKNNVLQGRKGKKGSYGLYRGSTKGKKKVTKVNQNYAHKGTHFSVSQNKEPLF